MRRIFVFFDVPNSDPNIADGVLAYAAVAHLTMTAATAVLGGFIAGLWMIKVVLDA